MNSITVTHRSDSPDPNQAFGPPVLPRSFRQSNPVRRLVQKFQTGEEREENFRRLFDRYYRRVYGFFAKRGVDPEQCEDLAQETFLRVYQSLNRFRHRSGFETWLFVIAANIYRDLLREGSTQKRFAAEIPLQSLLEDPSGVSSGAEPRCEEPDAFDRFLKQERLRLVRRVIEELPERLRRCLILHFYHGLSYQDVARILRLPLGSVKAHVHEGKRRLRLRIRRRPSSGTDRAALLKRSAEAFPERSLLGLRAESRIDDPAESPFPLTQTVPFE